jgi:hypothetical protein
VESPNGECLDHAALSPHAATLSGKVEFSES